LRDKINSIIARYDQLGLNLMDQAIVTNQKKLKETAQEHSRLDPIVKLGKKLIGVLDQIIDDKEVLEGRDDDLKLLVKEELPELEAEKINLEEKLKRLLLPRDPNDDKNTIVEIRAGTGGDEAGLFAADLYRMYSRFAERSNWVKEVLDSSDTGIGGLKEIVFSVQGKGSYGLMKFESGVHRVQRVPKTETSGRIHTSAATVAILPEAEDAEIEVRDEDLKIDTYRASGAGGQHVNKTESAIRITHLPTGLVVTCQDETSQHKNRAAAMKVLKSRMLAAEQDRIARERAVVRKSMVSSGDRSAKIRTYNFPQGRITDHRINYSAFNLEAFLDGDLFDIIEELRLAEQQDKLAESELS